MHGEGFFFQAFVYLSAAVVALDDEEQALATVRAMRGHFPELPILARAMSRRSAYDLLEAGAAEVYRETLDTSLRAGTDALRRLGFRAHQAHRAAQLFRRRDERALHQQAGVRHDRVAYLGQARAAIRELEESLRSELGGPDETRDLGWDSESLRAEFGRPAGAALAAEQIPAPPALAADAPPATG